MKRTLALMLSFLLLISMVACSPAATEAQKRKPSGTPAIAPSTAYAVSLPMADGVTNFVQFTMEGGATFVIELYPEFAPKTVENFQHLVYAGFYNGLTFHRIVKDFILQGGDPNGDGSGASPMKIPGEFPDNEFTQNTLTHERGVVSMFRSTDKNSASCQFFITHQTARTLDGKYAAFGRVVAGMETIDAIAALEVEAQPISGEVSRPINAPVIASAYFVNFTAPAV